MKVSVIIPVFNAAKTLRKAIDSVLAQQTHIQFECIVIDGGSADGTLQILQEYEADNFRWISEKDKGIYDAMNKGIRLATGDWLYFLGADDYLYDSNVLKKIFASGVAGADVIYGNVFDEGLNRVYDGPFGVDKLLIRNICHQGVFYSREVFQKLGDYNTAYRLFADWDLNIRCFLHSEIRTIYTDVIIAFYAKGGVSAGYNDIAFFRNVLFPERLARLLEKGGRPLLSVLVYDQWWRLLRSMRTEGDESVLTSGGLPVPAAIRRMHGFQKHFPFAMLKVGVFSKATMFVSYCMYILSGLLQKS